jgi:ribonucleoside-diphosphate reductase alpha chain
LGQIESTNPCGEQPLLPNEPCNLGSINLSLFTQGDIGHATIDWTELKTTIQAAVRLLDDAIDVNNYPLPEIERMAKSNRRIGLGVMGWAETLVKLGLAYDSPEALDQAHTLMDFIDNAALEASESLALERGVFPNWIGSIYDPRSAVSRGEKHTPRNCARTTIAPTGTIGLAAGLQGAGIEPFYAIAYTRYNAKALDALKAGRAPDAADVYFEVNPLFRQVAEKNNFFGLSEPELWKRIENNQKSIRGLREIPADIQALFATAHDVSAESHVRMQAAFQAHTDNAVSKTVNLPHTATINDVKKVYLLAHELGCKGVTIYRDGSKKQQVLNFSTEPRKLKSPRDLSLGVSSEYYEMKTGHGPLHVHIDYDENGPQRLFASLSPVGTELAGLTSMLGVMVTKYVEQGGSASAIVKHLQSVKGDRPFGLGEARINSISHALGVALFTHLKKHGFLETENGNVFELDDPANLELWNLSNEQEQCPECFGTNVKHSAGCTGPICNDCGYSSCNI